MSYDLYQGCLRFTNRGTSFSVSRPTRSRRLACRAGTAPPLLQTPSHIRSDWPSGGAFQRACPRASFCHTSSDHHTKSAQNLYIIYDVTTCPLPRLDLFSSRIMAPEKPLVVVGSANADLVFNIERLPLAGETMAAFGLETIPGGKVRQRLPKLLNLRHSPWNSLSCCMCCDAIQGANQAAAAAMLGCQTYFIGQVGDVMCSLLLFLQSHGAPQRVSGSMDPECKRTYINRTLALVCVA